LTSFVGRERELDEIWSLFREGKRLVTVIDTGGIGKTCLALQLCLGGSISRTDYEARAHVFQNFYPILDEAADALDRAGQLLTAHLARKPA
jgi:hypothetical protein